MTQLRKELNQEKFNKLLLKDANLWQIAKYVYKRFDSEVWAFIAFIELAVIIFMRTK